MIGQKHSTKTAVYIIPTLNAIEWLYITRIPF